MENWFGDKMRRRRESRGMSQRDLGEIAGIDRASISQYEMGDSEPGLMKAITLAKILNINLMKMPIKK